MTKIRRISLYKIAIVGVFFATLIYILPTEKVSASGTISGIVYLDYNMNGNMDTSGVAPNRSVDKAFGDGILVTVFDGQGVERGNATTTNGSYSITATGTGPYRVEFTNLPSGFNPSAKGTNNSGTVQIIPDGTSSNVNLAVISQKDYCQNNPNILFNCYFLGNAFGDSEVLVGVPSGAGGDISESELYKFRKPVVFSTAVLQSQIGPTWGLDYSSGAKRAYAAAHFKKHTVFGPSGSGAIYLIDPLTSTVTSTFTVPGATTNSHGTDTSACVGASSVVGCDNGNIGWDAVGKTSLGGLALSDDGTNLYVMNLENRTLYELNAVTGVEQRHQSVPGVPNVAGSISDLSGVVVPGSVNETNIRPFAVTYDNDKIYIGLVTSAETTPTVLTNLRAHVYEVDPTTFSFTLRFSVNLDYDRGRAYAGSVDEDPAEWNAWRTDYASIDQFFGVVVYPQPWLTDITFDDSEDMILGIRDRVADQTGYLLESDPSDGFEQYTGASAGDTLKACGDFTSGWTVENNGSCGGVTGGIPNNGEGIGGGEYFWEDSFQTKTEIFQDEVSLGGLNHIPGYSEVASTTIVPVESDQVVYSGGIRWWDVSGADTQRAYLHYATVYDFSDTFGIAGGMGDIVAMCEAAPLQIGDRVWNDADSDGIQDSNELPIANVDLNLSADTTGDGTPDTIVGTAVTDSNGNYTFGGVDDNNLLVISGCTKSVLAETPIDEPTDDAIEFTDNSVQTYDFEARLGDNLNINSSALRFANVKIPNGATVTEAYIQFTSNDDLGESTDDTTVTISVENQDDALTYEDTSSNISSRSYVGSTSWAVPLWFNESERDLDQRTPSLNTLVQQIVNRSGWANGNAMAFRFTATGADRVDAEVADDLYHNVARLVIRYNQACDYSMEPTTVYEIQIPSDNFDAGEVLEDFAPTPTNFDSSSNGDSRDSDGTASDANQVVARFTSGLNGRNEHNHDFGFIENAGAGTVSTIFSIGNRLWFDIDNDGIIDPTEEGIAGVSVTLINEALAPPLSEGGNAINGTGLNTVTTDANGYYRFDGLIENDYSIRIDSSNFGSGGALEAYRNTTGINTGDVESQGASVNAENGENPANHTDVLVDGIKSNVITIGPTEPTLEQGVPTSGIFAGHGTFDAQSDTTVDFGFYNLSLSGTVWGDNSTIGNSNGIMDSGETGVVGYTVRLFDDSDAEVNVGPDGILGTGDDAIGGVTTDSSGVYNFQGLSPGDYRVVLSPNGVSSSNSGDANEETNPNLNGDNNDNGFPDNTGNFAGEIISGLVTLTPGSLGSQSNNTVNNATGATVNPTVDFGLLLAPTQVKMHKLTAFYDGHNVVIEWNTEDEIDNLGFNVYRETNGQREDLNDALIAGSALKTAARLNVKGENYRWIDKNSQYGSGYYVEDLAIDGNKTIHGPIYPKMNYGFSSYGQVSSQLVSQISSPNLASKQKEFIGKIPVSDSDSLWDYSQTTLERQREIASSKGVKIFVKEDGLYQIKLNELETAGFDIGGDKRHWRLFVNSREVPININDDGVSFYGNALDSQLSDVSVYYLIQGNIAGMRLKNTTYGKSRKPTMFNYEVTTQVEDHSIYVPSLLNGDKSNWFGAVIYPNRDTIQDISVNDPYDDDKNLAHLKVKLQGLTAVDHLVSVEFNDTNLGVVKFDGRGNQEFEFELPMSAVYSDVNQVRLRSTGASNDISLIDEISLRYSRGYKAKNGKIQFSLPSNETAKIDGFTSDEIELFELGKDGHLIAKVEINPENMGDSYGFRITGSSYNQRFVAINRSEYSTQTLDIQENHPSNLSANFNRGKFVIITPNKFSKEASTLAARREEQGWKTLVVKTDDIYDEYSFGVRSNDAIKAFLKDASTKWTIKAEYVLLFGDSSADHRNYLNQEFRDFIPTKFVETEFSETASDGWFADFDDDGIEDLSIGRLPVGTRIEARNILLKLNRYDQQEKRTDYINLLVADNDFNGFNDYLEGILPENASAARINRSQMSDPQMKREIISNMEENPMVVTYTGHGSTGVWANPYVLNSDDAASFDNEKLAFFMLMTCLNGYNHSPYSDSMAEKLIKTENGAIAVWASSGSTYTHGQILMSSQATGDLYNQSQQSMPIGDITRMTKHTTNDSDARRTWLLIGDPTVVIK